MLLIYIDLKCSVPHDDRKFWARYQLAKPWGQNAHTYGIGVFKVLPQAVARFSPRVYLFLFLNKDTDVGTSQWNEIDMKLRRTTSLKTKSMQSPITVTETHSGIGLTRMALKLHKTGCKFSQAWLIVILVRYSSFNNICCIFRDHKNVIKNTFATSCSRKTLRAFYPD